MIGCSYDKLGKRKKKGAYGSLSFYDSIHLTITSII